MRPEEFPRLHQQVMSWPRGPGVSAREPDFALRPFTRAFPMQAGRQVRPGARVHLRMASFNVLSLLDGKREVQSGLHGAAGRPTLLAQSLLELEVHLAGFQECRTPRGTMRCGSFTRFSSGCDDRACFGVEMWVCHHGPCCPSSVTVLYTSCTLLIASLKIGSCPALVLVGHAPHRSHASAAKQDWWKHASHVCHSFANGTPWVCLLDANRRLGSRASIAVGDYQADAEDESGTLFHSLLLDLGGWLPATFGSYMCGDGGTLLQKRNGELERSDFIALPSGWGYAACCAWVEPSPFGWPRLYRPSGHNG